MAASRQNPSTTGSERTVFIPSGDSIICGDLTTPDDSRGIVVIAHGRGSSWSSRRDRSLAAELNRGGLATLLVDLLTIEEAAVDEQPGERRFDTGFLTRRLVDAIDWVARERAIRNLPLGVFGASTSAAAALFAAARRSSRVKAVVSRGGRPDLAASVLSIVDAPTLLIVGENDPQALTIAQLALSKLGGQRRLVIVSGASPSFEEPGALDTIAAAARGWFAQHLVAEFVGIGASFPW
jgi:putative phosphoribosyl transferase